MSPRIGLYPANFYVFDIKNLSLMRDFSKKDDRRQALSKLLELLLWIDSVWFEDLGGNFSSQSLLNFMQFEVFFGG